MKNEKTINAISYINFFVLLIVVFISWDEKIDLYIYQVAILIVSTMVILFQGRIIAERETTSKCRSEFNSIANMNTLCWISFVISFFIALNSIHDAPTMGAAILFFLVPFFLSLQILLYVLELIDVVKYERREKRRDEIRRISNAKHNE